MRLSSVIRRVEAKAKRIKIVVLGLDNAGKTSLLSAFTGKGIEDIPPTFGYQVVHAEMEHEGEAYALELLDIGGQESIRAYWDTYYAGAHGVLFVYDTCTPSQHTSILESLISHPTLRRAAVICAANKADAVSEEEAARPGVVTVQRYAIEEEVPFDFVDAMEVLKGCSTSVEKAVPIYYTSAKTGLNVRKVFAELVVQILEDRRKNGIL
ncbi:ADP-ribosylation factor-like protein 2 [Nematocida sp. AWRm77]|nr:ADP-ribosylation factor-like protein 2 [Nematocida sp. AWRm77]